MEFVYENGHQERLPPTHLLTFKEVLMRKKSRILTLLLCGFVCLSGCGKNGIDTVDVSDSYYTQGDSSDLTSIPIDDNIETTLETENLNPPNCSIDDFAENIELNGIKLSLPCALESLKETLGDEYTFDNLKVETELGPNGEDWYYASIMYNNVEISRISYTLSEEVYSMSFYVEVCSLKINDVNISEIDKNLFIQKYGNPTYGEINDYVHSYFWKLNNCVMVTYDVENKDDTIWSIFICKL